MGIAVQLHILLVFDLNSVEIVGTVDYHHHPQAAAESECGLWVCPLAQQAVGMSDSYMQLLQPPDNRPMLLVRRSRSLLSHLLFLSFSFSYLSQNPHDSWYSLIFV